jgi:ribosomal protein L22
MSAENEKPEKAETPEVVPTSEGAAEASTEIGAGSEETAASSSGADTTSEVVDEPSTESGDEPEAEAEGEPGVEAVAEEAPKRPRRRRRTAKAEDKAGDEQEPEKAVADEVEEAVAEEPEEAVAEEPEEAVAEEPEKAVAEKPKKRAAAKKPAAGKKNVSDKKPSARPRRGRTGRKADEPLPLVRAQAKYVRSSARKARLVCDHIRGKSVPDARAILSHTSRAVARDWSKLLESAVANAEHNHELVGEDLYVKAVQADEGPTIKRFRPRAQGRATRIRKRTSHLTILLTPKD